MRLSALATLAAMGTGVGWTFGAGDPTGQLAVADASSGAIRLQIDDVLFSADDLDRTGVTPRSPLPEEDPALAANPAESSLKSVLVYMHPALRRASVERANVKALAGQRGGFVQYEYRTVMPNVLNLRNLPDAAVEALKKMPGVVKVKQDVYHPNLVKLDEATPLVRGLQSQITGAGLSADGTGVRVCVCDTGIDTDHIMYADRIDFAASYDFNNNDSNPEDDHGHGSHVSGIAVGGTGLVVTHDAACAVDKPFQGVAPEATLIGVKILNSFGGGSDSNIIAGIDHCADQSPSGGRADVINLSIGTGAYSGPCTHSWAVAANNAVANGVVVVAASGNECNSNAMGSPACGADVIAVGATWKDDYPNCEDSQSTFYWSCCTSSSPSEDAVVCFSNESDYLDVTAPGAVMWSASTAAGGTQITTMSGTSMASPMVAGLAALVLDVDPTLTPAEVRTIIRNGATDLGPTGFDRGYGYGRIDVINTLNQLTPCTSDADCDDGLWCNGAETCVDQSCEPGTPPCGSDPCDEATDTCFSVAYEWDLNTNPGWTTQGLWAWGQPTGGGGQYGGPDPTSGYTGSNVYGYNLSGDYENNLPETHLTSTAIDCSAWTNVTLRFRRWLGVEQPTYDHAYIRVSNNGSTWTTIWENGAEVADSTWSLQEFDISSIADNQLTVYLRWTMGTTDGSWQYCGWNIDDIQLWATGGGPTCSDGIQNQGEDRIDCGGPCPPCECTSDAACDDGAYCNGAETCDAYGTCQPGTAPDCNDGVDCTDDSCNEGTDSCDNIANDANCDNGLFCDGAETCHATLDCQSGTAVDCNDGVGCTDDSCNEGTDSCDNIADDANCDNGLYCDGAETCHATLDCQSGTAVDCNDGVGCTDDSCNEGTDSCDNIANDANCDNGLYCDGAETCHATLDCQSGTAVDCNDGVGCTDDSCNETTDSCDNIANDANCDNGLFCDGAETCHATLDCQAGSDPCPGQTCDEVNDICTDCITNEDCDDGLYCNGAETCDAGTCLPGTAVDCNDGVGCTDDSCNEGTDSCDNVANDTNCDDGLYCNGAETCHATLDCQAGTAVDCNDGVGCTDDSCNEGTDSCDNVANDANCPDDGLFCNGTEYCDAVSDCASTGDPCGSGEICNETTDTCDPSGCDNDGTCETGEDCNTCPNDCFTGVGAVCGNNVCETADGEDCSTCSADCNGLLTGKPDYRYCCGDGTGAYGVTCADSRCTGGGNTCTNAPAVPSCCGDGICEDTEDVVNCAVDCGCTVPADCDDSNECTVDDCVGGVCEYTPVADDTPCSGGICCDGMCDAPVCSISADCNDSDSCTTDTCYNGDTCAAYCDNVWPACGIADGCCGPACTPANDTDCECLLRGAPCTEDTECCSLKCLGSGTCK